MYNKIKKFLYEEQLELISINNSKYFINRELGKIAKLINNNENKVLLIIDGDFIYGLTETETLFLSNEHSNKKNINRNEYLNHMQPKLFKFVSHGDILKSISDFKYFFNSETHKKYNIEKLDVKYFEDIDLYSKKRYS